MEILSDSVFKGRVNFDQPVEYLESEFHRGANYFCNGVYASGDVYFGKLTSNTLTSNNITVSDSISTHGVTTDNITVYNSVSACSVSADGTGGFVTASTRYCANGIQNDGHLLTLPLKAGTIALTSDIPDISSIKSVKYAQMMLTAPSDCTLFAVDLSVTGFSFTNDTDIISARVDRYFLSGDADANPNLGYCYWEPTSTDIILSCPPSATEPGKIVIRKASGVAFDNEKRYMLKLAYT